jgi:hypothetical protein
VNLNPHQITKLISNDHIVVSSEKMIFDSVVRWINFDAVNRKHYFKELIEHIRFPLMENKDLHKLLDHQLIKDDLYCKNFLLESINLKSDTPLNLEVSSESNPEFLRPRVPLDLPKVTH